MELHWKCVTSNLFNWNFGWLFSAALSMDRKMIYILALSTLQGWKVKLSCSEADILASHALKTNGGSSIAATPVCWCCFRLLWVRISVCPSFLMGSLGGECHPSAGWMRCPKDLYQACLLSSSLLNCKLDFSWSAVWEYEFSFEMKKQKHHTH